MMHVERVGAGGSNGFDHNCCNIAVAIRMAERGDRAFCKQTYSRGTALLSMATHHGHLRIAQVGLLDCVYELSSEHARRADSNTLWMSRIAGLRSHRTGTRYGAVLSRESAHEPARGRSAQSSST